MAFCSFSSSQTEDGYTLVDNNFISEFLPQAPSDYVKVYLYGLSLCSNANYDYNTADNTCAILQITEDELISALEYWQELSLVQIISKKPLEVKYLRVKAHSGSAKIRNKSKYTDFNKQVQNIITGRMIKPIEFNEYYNIIESLHFDPDALIMIIKYCTVLKGENVGYPYILAVAKNFASDNVKSTEAVEKRFLEQEKSTLELKQVLDVLGLKRAADMEERNNYLKWTNNFGFTHGVILEVAKTIKNGGMHKLDEMLTKYYEQHLFSMQEIAEYNQTRDEMFDIAKNVSRNLGLYYQNLENVVETYVSSWLNMGFNKETLLQISNYCFKNSFRSLESMHDTVQRFFKLGLVSTQAINQYTNSLIETDKKIKEVLDTCGLVRNVNSSDRSFYKIWTESWHFEHQTILLVSKKAFGKTGPIAYMNKILSNLASQNKNSLADTKAYLESNPTVDQSQKIISHDYSKEELDAMFDSLDDIEV